MSDNDTNVLSSGVVSKFYKAHSDDPLNGVRMLKTIEAIARISHRSEDSPYVTETSYDRFLRSVVLEHGDWSVTEHCSVTVELVVDRGITHELVRHRIAAYTQESTRFVNYKKKMKPTFICPAGVMTDPDSFEIWLHAIKTCEDAYRKLIDRGHAPQIARSVFPNALASKIVVTFNLRQWRHFFLMRTTKNTHPQMLEVTVPLLETFQKHIPILYEDIVPMRTQKENLGLGR